MCRHSSCCLLSWMWTKALPVSWMWHQNAHRHQKCAAQQGCHDCWVLPAFASNHLHHIDKSHCCCGKFLLIGTPSLFLSDLLMSLLWQLKLCNRPWNVFNLSQVQIPSLSVSTNHNLKLPIALKLSQFKFKISCRALCTCADPWTDLLLYKRVTEDQPRKGCCCDHNGW